MKPAYFLILAFLAVANALNAQKEGLQAININDLKAYMTFFASDEMKGRETGSPENDLAALYLKTNIMRLGLKPMPGTGDYLQRVPLEASEIKGGETYIKVKDSSGKELYTNDSIIYLMAPFNTLDVTSDVVFAGYGFEDSTAGYDDFKGIDIKDKTVIIMTGSPEFTNPDDLNSVFRIETERPKIMAAFSRGVRAILYVYDPRSKFSDAYASGLADMGASGVGTKVMSLKPFEGSSPLQVAFITRNTADQILKNSGYDLRQAEEKIISEKKSFSFDLKNITLTFRTFIEHSKITAYNVIGIVEGSDPLLKNECVLYTAHFDHVGVNNKGETFNGADDNASGSMALLEVSQAFMSLKKKPLRTIVFAWVTGEEKGLLGSQFYASDPVIPMEKTLVDINLDMVGRSRMPSDTGKFMGFEVNVSQKGEILLYTDQKGTDILDLIKSTSNEAGIKTINMGKDPEIGSSDYASFMEKGVPAIFFNSGDYPDLHTISDDVEKIDFDKMERVSKMVFLLGYDIANEKKRFVPDTIQ
jgi:hypothetical protein